MNRSISQLNALLPPQPCNVQEEELFVHGIIERILVRGELGFVSHCLRIILIQLFRASIPCRWQMTHCFWVVRIAVVGERRGALGV